jgi:HEAT repeat protein
MKKMAFILIFTLTCHAISFGSSSQTARKSSQKNVKSQPQYGVVLPAKYKLSNGHINMKQWLRDLKSENYQEFGEAFDVLNKVGAKAIPDIFEYLEKESEGFPKRDYFAASILDVFGKDALPFLLAKIKTGPKLSRLISIQHIGNLLYFQTNPAARNPKLKFGPGNGDDAWIFDSRLKNALLDAAEDSNSLIKVASIELCSNFGYRSVMYTAEKFLQDKKQERYLRLKVLDALARLDNDNTHNLVFLASDLLTNLKSEEFFMSLKNIRTESAYRILLRLLVMHEATDDEDILPLQGQVISLLSGFDKEELIPILIECLKSSNSSVRFRAATAIGKSKYATAVRQTKTLLKSSDRQSKRGAIYGIGESKKDDAFLTLCNLVIGQDEFASDALKALGDIDDERVDKFLEYYLEYGSDELKLAAKQSAEKLARRRKG